MSIESMAICADIHTLQYTNMAGCWLENPIFQEEIDLQTVNFPLLDSKNGHSIYQQTGMYIE